MIKTVLSSWIARGITAFSQLYVARLVAQSIGLDGYATFALLLALGGWVMLLDFGLGAALQNYIAECRTLSKSDNEYRSFVFLAHIITLVAVLIVAAVASTWLGPVYLKASNLSAIEASGLFALACALWMLNAVGSTGLKILYAESKGYVANTITALGYGMGVFSLALTNYFVKDPTVGLLFGLWVFSIAIPGAIALTYRSVPSLTWKINKGLFSHVLRRAGGVFLFALLGAGTLQIDYLVMSQFLPDKEIAIYNIITKVFTLVLFVYSAVLTALWPVITMMVADGNWAEVARQINKYLKIGFAISAVMCVCVILAMPQITSFIVPAERIEPGIFFLVLMSVYVVVRVWTDTYAQVLLSASRTKPLIIWAAIQGLVTLVCQVVFVRFFGSSGIVAALIISYVLTVAWALPREVSKMIRAETRAI